MVRALASHTGLDGFISTRKATRGLTPDGEKWLYLCIRPFLEWLPVRQHQLDAQVIESFLSRYNDKPWRKDAMYRALKSFCKWLSRTYDIANPFLDRHGNCVIDAPKLPEKILPTQTPETVRQLMEGVDKAHKPKFRTRNKAVISLLADSGGRRKEIVGARVQDTDLEGCWSGCGSSSIRAILFKRSRLCWPHS